jgi:hypothetical protein
MESLLISNARCIRFANAQGVKKIIRNTLALQQGIKVITSQPLNREFDRVKRYYSLFLLPSQVRFVMFPCILCVFKPCHEGYIRKRATEADLQLR